EVRAFFDRFEDPVTGSLNAGLAQWLVGTGRLPSRYVAAQGTRLGRSGRVHVAAEGATTWVGGATTTVIARRVAFDLRVAPIVLVGAHAGLPRPARADPRRGRGEDRPHRHRDAERPRPPGALRPGGRLPAGHHQEGAHPQRLRRAALVPARRHQREVAA